MAFRHGCIAVALACSFAYARAPWTEPLAGTAARSVAVESGTLHAGLPDGRVVSFSTQTSLPTHTRFGGDRPVVRVAAQGDRLAWMDDQGRVYVEHGGSVRLLLQREGVASMGWLGGRVALLGRAQRSLLIDPATGSTEGLEALLPADERLSELRIAAGTLYAVRPFSRTMDGVTVSRVTGFRWEGSRLVRRSSFASPVFGQRVGAGPVDAGGRFTRIEGFEGMNGAVAWGETGFSALLGGGVLRVDLMKPFWEPERTPMSADPAGVLRPGPLTPLGYGAGRAWFAAGRGLLAVDATSGQADLFLSPTAQETVVAGDVDTAGLWVATTRGIRHVAPGRPCPESGFGGMVRLPLHSPERLPLTETQTRLVQLLESWIGTPYRWGGNDRNGVDCSGLVVAVFRELGIRLPRTSADIGRDNSGALVRDELLPGDVIVVPGHVLVHVGNGHTIETVRGGVGRSTIWRRDLGVVRRFLDEERAASRPNGRG